MTDTFSGCLVYEFSEEPNRYGLAKISGKDGSVREMKDYAALASKYAAIPTLPKDVPTNVRAHASCPDQSTFLSINGANKLPSLPEIEALILTGVTARPGRLTELSSLPATNYMILDASGVEIVDKAAVVRSGVNRNVPDLRPLLQTTGYAPSSLGLSVAELSGSSTAGSTSDSASTSGVSGVASSHLRWVIMLIVFSLV